MRRAQRRKFHYIYRITNKLNGKFYIGMHSTDDLEDGYFGSGTRLCRSINKYGKENHEMEILEHYFSRENLAAREAEIINEEFLSNPQCMNIRFGGEGGWDHVHKSRSNLESPKMKEYLHSPENLIKLELGRTSESRSKGSKTLWETKRELMVETSRKNVSKTLSDEAKSKRKETFARNGHQSGEANSQFGKCWINDGDKSIRVQRQELSEWLEKGWKKGRKSFLN